MSKTTTEKVSGHNAVIAKVQANAAAEQKGWQDAMRNAIILMIAVYDVILAEVFKPSGLPESEWKTLRGGAYWGLACGKKDHAFRYSGKPENYPSSTYLSFTFTLKYLHTAARLEEFRATNTVHQVKHYVQWLAIQYGWKLDHCKLDRDPVKVMAKWKTVKGTPEQRSDGRQFATCVLKDVPKSDPNTAYKDLNKAINAAVKLETLKDRREAIGDWDVENYSQSSILELITALTAQWMIVKDREDTAEASKLRRAASGKS